MYMPRCKPFQRGRQKPFRFSWSGRTKSAVTRFP
jgi:hypothetical protein